MPLRVVAVDPVLQCKEMKQKIQRILKNATHHIERFFKKWHMAFLAIAVGIVIYQFVVLTYALHDLSRVLYMRHAVTVCASEQFESMPIMIEQEYFCKDKDTGEIYPVVNDVQETKE